MPNSSTFGMYVTYVGTVRGVSGRDKESTNSIVEDTSRSLSGMPVFEKTA